MDAVNKHEATNQIRDNRYIEMAKDYLGEAIKSAKKVRENKDQIISIKDFLDSQVEEIDKLKQEKEIYIKESQKQLDTLNEKLAMLDSS